jgi:hypothetical protein
MLLFTGPLLVVLDSIGDVMGSGLCLSNSDLSLCTTALLCRLLDFVAETGTRLADDVSLIFAVLIGL